MRKVLVLGAGHRGSGGVRVIADLVEQMRGAVEFVMVDPVGDSPSGDSTALLDELLKPLEVRLEDFVAPESEVKTGWDPGAVNGSYSMTMKLDDESAALFERFVEQIRAAELVRDIQRMGKMILVGAGPGVHVTAGYGQPLHMGAQGEKVVAKSKGKVHTTGRSRAARADRWR